MIVVFAMAGEPEHHFGRGKQRPAIGIVQLPGHGIGEPLPSPLHRAVQRRTAGVSRSNQSATTVGRIGRTRDQRIA